MTSRGFNTLREVDPSVVDDDPFWSTVVREHPDATYVLLPPDDPSPPAPDGPAGATRDELRRAADVWRTVLAPLLARAGATDTAATGWRGGRGARRFVIKQALVGIGRPAGVDLIARAGVALGLAGWQLLPERYDDRSVLRGRDADLDFDAVAGAGACVLTLATRAGVVDAESARFLAEQVPSWL